MNFFKATVAIAALVMALATFGPEGGPLDGAHFYSLNEIAGGVAFGIFLLGLLGMAATWLAARLRK